MALKTFNVESETYRKFSEFCRGSGLSMSKQIEFFMRSIVEDDPETKRSYLEKLDNIRKQKSISIGNIVGFKKRYNLK